VGTSKQYKEANMGERVKIIVENIKCGGCEKSIVRALAAMPAVSEIAVDRQERSVAFVGELSLRQEVAKKLLSLGYPESGSVEGLSAGLAGAKSFVSCAVGRLS
jgi:copper chaperone